MRASRLRPSLFLVLAWTALACSPGTPDAPATFVRDSAGIRIVTHDPVDDPALTLADAPVFRAGIEDTLTLYEVRDGILRSDGGAVLADSGNRRLVFLTPDGSVLRTAGGEGDGPGEFRQVDWLHAGSDGETTAWDAAARRLTAVDTAGEPVGSRTFRPRAPDAPSEDALVTRGTLLGVLGDGRAIGYSGASADPTGEPGVLPVTMEMELFHQDLRPADSLGRVVIMEWFEDPSREGVPLASYLGAARLHWSGRGDRFAHTSGLHHRIEVLDGGRASLVVVEERPRLPFEPDSVPEGSRVADSLPAYQDLTVDADRRIWVRVGAHERDPVVPWRVFGADGAVVGVLPLPSDATVLDAAGPMVLLLRRDELDQEYVEARPMEGASEG